MFGVKTVIIFCVNKSLDIFDTRMCTNYGYKRTHTHTRAHACAYTITTMKSHLFLQYLFLCAKFLKHQWFHEGKKKQRHKYTAVSQKTQSFPTRRVPKKKFKNKKFLKRGEGLVTMGFYGDACGLKMTNQCCFSLSLILSFTLFLIR